MKDKGTSRRGRPPSTSAARIARTALELFTRDGYDATTLDDVAVAAGVSRSTVLRYLPGKGAIVWADEEAAGAALLADLAGRVPGPRWRTQVASVLIGAIRFPPDELRMRLRLIEQVPSLRRHLDATAAPVIAALAEHIARSTGEAPGGLGPYTVSRTAWWTAMDALLWWSRSGEGDPRDVVRTSLAAVGLAPTPARLGATVLDARDPARLARFYADLLGWPVVVEESDWVMLRDPAGGAGISVQLEPLHVAPTWPARIGQEQIQLHLDVAVDDLAGAAHRAVRLGATVAAVQPQPDVRVLLDPEGHPFCLFVG